MENYFILIDANGRVKQTQTTSAILSNLEPPVGKTFVQVTIEKINYFNAWLQTGDHQLTYLTYDSQSGEFTSHSLSEVPATIDKTAITANGTDFATISNIPNPSNLIVQSIGVYKITDGTFEMTTQVKGAYHIVIESEGYLPKEFTINAS
jgi:hypothetical protein